MLEQDGSKPVSISFWLFWTLATALGAAVGSATFEIVQGTDYATFVIAGLFGLAIGITQALVLWQTIYSKKQWLRLGIPWILANIAGWFIGIVASVVGLFIIALFLMLLNVGDYAIAYEIGESPLPMVLVGIFGGLVLGLLEQRILHARSIPVSWWPRTCALGWLAAGFVGWGVGNLVPGSESLKWIVGGAAAGVVAGAITGSVLARVVATQSSRGEARHE